MTFPAKGPPVTGWDHALKPPHPRPPLAHLAVGGHLRLTLYVARTRLTRSGPEARCWFRP